MRPLPTEERFVFGRPFVAAPELLTWATETFIAEDAVLLNEDHAHLRSAQIGMLWTVAPNSRRGRTVIGQAEMAMPPGSMGKWQKARWEQQIVEWFGDVPDFIITIDATYWIEATDAECCALIEHELYHCAQATDEFGMPRFNKQTGRPVFTLRGHDVEEFVGVVRRYGAGAAHVRRLVDAANRRPEIGEADISDACGTCLARAA